MEQPQQIDPGEGQVEQKVEEIVAAAQRLGVELDRKGAEEWIIAVSRSEHEDALAQDPNTGVFGHRISLLDFDPSELAAFRRLAELLRFERDPDVESAIAIAGSAAQGKVQPFPGDNDFFERVNIRTASLEQAQALLRKLMHRTAMRAFAQPDVVLVDVNFGVFPQDVSIQGKTYKQGHSITWTSTELLHGRMEAQDTDGKPLTLAWDDVPVGTGMCFFSWIVADRQTHRIVFASNMLDVTWESPSGEIVPLDGSLDAFFQEIYLEPQALPIFNKIIRHLDPGAKAAYVDAMRHQVYHYMKESPNFGKVSKRLYNLFRLTDQLEAAAYVRELFDEPGAELYQVPSLLEAANYAMTDEERLGRETVVAQIDAVVDAVSEVVLGRPEEELLTHLARLREQIAATTPNLGEWSRVTEEVDERCLELVNEYFRARLFGFAPIADALAQWQA